MTPLMGKLIGGLAIALLVVTLVAPVYYFGPGGDGVLDHLTLEDGSEFSVAQRYNDHFSEPYSVDFYVRSPGSSWGWCYIAHQDMRWTRARLRYNEQDRSIRVYRGFWLTAAYFLERQTFVLYSGRERMWGAPSNYREPQSKTPKQAMQLTASKPADCASRVCRRASMLRRMQRGLAAAYPVSR